MTSLVTAQLSSLNDQRPLKRGIAQKIIFDNQNYIDNYINNVIVNGGDITVNQSGVYFIVASPRVKELYNTCSIQYIDFWIDVNGKSLSNSGVRLSLLNNKQTDVIVSQRITQLKTGDIISVWMNVVGTKLNCSQTGIVYFPPLDSVAAIIPSIIFSLYSLTSSIISGGGGLGGSQGALGTVSLISTLSELNNGAYYYTFELKGNIASCVTQIQSTPIENAPKLLYIEETNLWTITNLSDDTKLHPSNITINTSGVITFTFTNEIFCPSASKNIPILVKGGPFKQQS